MSIVELEYHNSTLVFLSQLRIQICSTGQEENLLLDCTRDVPPGNCGFQFRFNTFVLDATGRNRSPMDLLA
jgi:hypothetical protein